jgi:uncharacterized protein (DUF1697 family)
MITYIALLRGINVSGQRMIKMDALREMFADLGFKNIQTYIQSGNIIFQSDQVDCQNLSAAISNKIRDQFGFEVYVMVLKPGELAPVLENNPFLKIRTEEITGLYITLLSQEPEQSNIDKINSRTYIPDKFIISGKTVYLFCPNGYGRTKLTNSFFENKLKVIATTRNWKTINELVNITENISKKAK